MSVLELSRSASDGRSRARRRAARLTPRAARRDTHMFNINRGVDEPETVDVNERNGMRVTRGGSKPRDGRNLVAPSRTMELLTERDADRFIRAVQRKRADLSEQVRYMGKLWGAELPTRFPAMGGGAQAATQQGVESNPASAAGGVIPFC